MKGLSYAIKSLLHYWKLNLTIVLGVALSTAILVGAFVIGDSVSYSLKQITLQRLGKTTWVVSGGERLFREELAQAIANPEMETASLLFANGMAVLNGGEARVGQLQVWGVNDDFNHFAETDSLFSLTGNEVVVNERLAGVLGVEVGDEFLLRVNKLSAFPANTPFVSADESSVAFRVKLKGIAGREATGNLNLQAIQSVPKNIFIGDDFLCRQMQLEHRANVLLVGGEGITRGQLADRLTASWTVDDLNLIVRENQELGYTELISDRVFIEPAIESSLLNEESGSYSVFSYFINEFECREKRTPYSFVAGLPKSMKAIPADGIILNEWLAEDLQAQVGDTITLRYFEVGPLRQLTEQESDLQVAEVVPMADIYGDVNLMPDIPGLSDAGHCRDWETGVPVDLASIRPKDEVYWNDYKGTPKAFVSYETAKKLWRNRFGEATAIRVDGANREGFEQVLLNALSPESVGFELKNAKEDGLQAAGQGVDFGGLFIGLSFFVLIAALLLAYLMFQLYLGFRRLEIGTLHALGFSAVRIQKLFFVELVLIVALGTLLGIPLGLAYNNLIMEAINTIWRDIVRTSILDIYITPAAIIQAVGAVIFIGLLSGWLILKKYARETVVLMQQGARRKQRSGKLSFWLGLLLVGGSLALMLSQGVGEELNAEVFFMSGLGLMPGLILLVDFYFRKQGNKNREKVAFSAYAKKLVLGDRKRNMLIIGFLTVGVFLVLSTGLNRKDLSRNADKASSGTGGYTFFAETSFPVLVDLNSKEGRFELGLEESEASFLQLQAAVGDDASCLNLNRVKRPRILGVDPMKLDARGAFSFVTKADEVSEEHPWESLNKILENGQIPAVADQTVIQWGLGKAIGDTLIYQSETGEQLVLKLVGGLANSVFQGNLLIADQYFYSNFPSVSGSQVFLIDAPEAERESLQRAFRNYGIDLSLAKDRLLLFYQIENTYLNIFLMLGALGLLIGTLGLGIVIFRRIYECRTEYALLLALGYRKQQVRKMVLKGNMQLVGIALLLGLTPAVLSALPALKSSLYTGLIIWAMVIVGLVLLSAWLWVFLANRMAFRGKLIETLRND